MPLNKVTINIRVVENMGFVQKHWKMQVKGKPKDNDTKTNRLGYSNATNNKGCSLVCKSQNMQKYE